MAEPNVVDAPYAAIRRHLAGAESASEPTVLVLATELAQLLKERDEYANTITWGTTCHGCAKQLDTLYDERVAGYLEGKDDGRREAAAAIRARAASFLGEQFRHFEMAARVADGERVPPTVQDPVAVQHASEPMPPPAQPAHKKDL